MHELKRQVTWINDYFHSFMAETIIAVVIIATLNPTLLYEANSTFHFVFTFVPFGVLKAGIRQPFYQT